MVGALVLTEGQLIMLHGEDVDGVPVVSLVVFARDDHSKVVLQSA